MINKYKDFLFNYLIMILKNQENLLKYINNIVILLDQVSSFIFKFNFILKIKQYDIRKEETVKNKITHS